jgi:hypothetical protein
MVVYMIRCAVASISHIVADQGSIRLPSQSPELIHDAMPYLLLPSILNLPTVNVLMCGSLALQFYRCIQETPCKNAGGSDLKLL